MHLCASRRVAAHPRLVLLESPRNDVREVREEEVRLKGECLPFDAMPDVTRLFADVMARAKGARKFYPTRFELGAEYPAGRYPADRRAQVADVLERQNR